MRIVDHTLRSWLRRARRIDVRRRVAEGFVDAGLGTVLLLTLAVVAVAWTGRGDVFRTVCVICAPLGAALLIARARTVARRGVEVELASARRVARTRSADSVERSLRREILGATELQRDLDAGTLRGSPALATEYVRRVEARLDAIGLGSAVPRVGWWSRAVWGVAAAACVTVTVLTPITAAAIPVLLHGIDARPPAPPQPVWSHLEVVLEYPAHTERPTRRVPNPSGALRLPAGTRVTLEIEPTEAAGSGRIVLAQHGENLDEAPPPEIIELERLPASDPPASEASASAATRERPVRWTATFVVRGSGSWFVALWDGDAPSGDPDRHSAALDFELELDAPPEVELPANGAKKEASEMSQVDVRFVARDDFGVASAQLAFMTPDGEVQRLPIAGPDEPRRIWRDHTTWDLSTIPVAQRGELVYWVEVRDTDPGLGIDGLDDPPGKVARSPQRRLDVRDREQEHAENIRDLVRIRDAAVDILGIRLVPGPLFDDPLSVIRLVREAERASLPDTDPTGDDAEADDAPPSDAEIRAQGGSQLRNARALHDAAGVLVAMLSSAVGSFSVDTHTRERDVRTLAAMHERLLALHRAETETLEGAGVGAETRLPPADARRLLRALGGHNRAQIIQLEDEIHRLDDLVDAQIIRRLEELTARIEASQRKLVDLLEQLSAGDESVRPRIEPLQRRIDDDMRRFEEARRHLSKEVGGEYFNRDALESLQRQMQRQQILEALRDGDIERALSQARGNLEQVQTLRGQMQQRLGEAPESRLSPEEEARIRLLRELGRLQDEQRGVAAKASELHERWREGVKEAELSLEAADLARRAARQRRALEAINDARLSRAGRNAFEDAREAIEAIESLGQREDKASALEAFELADEAVRALERARAGTPGSEDEAQELAELTKRATKLRDGLASPLADPTDVLDASAKTTAVQEAQKQDQLRERARSVLDTPLGKPLPQAGRAAMQAAMDAMETATGRLQDADGRRALRDANAAGSAIQRVIDSLRNREPPPAAESSEQETSTEAERDRSLRDEVVEAMREQDLDAVDGEASRYYEELLK